MKVAVIPCRKNSQGIPGKNLKDFCGMPLTCWTLKAAAESGEFDRIIVASDWPEIESVLGEYSWQFEFVKRPDELCLPESQIEDTILWMGEKEIFDPGKVEYITILQPTSPLRTAKHIKGAFELILKDDKDSLVSVCSDPMLGWIKDAMTTGPIALYRVNERPNRQERGDWCKENGAIYITKPGVYSVLKCRINMESVALYNMPKLASIELDDLDDWMVAEAICLKTTS